MNEIRLNKWVVRCVHLFLMICLLVSTQVAYGSSNPDSRTLTETSGLINSFLWSEKQQIIPVIERIQTEGIQLSDIPSDVRGKIPSSLDGRDLQAFFIALLTPFYTDSAKEIAASSVVSTLQIFDQSITEKDTSDFINSFLTNLLNQFGNDDALLHVLRTENLNYIYEQAMAITLTQNLKVSLAFRNRSLTASDLTQIFNLINEFDFHRKALGTVFLAMLRLKLVENTSSKNNLSVGNAITNVFLNRIVNWDADGAKLSKSKIENLVGNRGSTLLDYLDRKLVFKVSAPTIKVNAITVLNSKWTIKKGSIATISYIVKPTNATNKKIAFKSSNPSVVSVSTNGQIVARKNGQAVILITSVSNPSIKSAIYVTVVTPVEGIDIPVRKITIDKGQAYKLIPSIKPATASNKGITWTSSNIKIATVRNGTVLGKANGKTVISATTNDGLYKAAVLVTVRKSKAIAVKTVELSEKKVSLYPGEKTKIAVKIAPNNATNKKVVWYSSNSSVLRVDQKGVLTAKSPGSAIVRATSIDGNHKSELTVIVKSRANKKLILSETKVVLYVSQTKTLKVTILPTSKNRQEFIWSSSNVKVASISQNGLIRAKKPGQTTIYVKSKDGTLQSKAQIIVKEDTHVISLKVNRTELKLERNKVIKLVATVLPKNATDRAVTWESSNPRIAVVLKTGEVIGRSKGKAVIWVRTKDGKHQVKVSVTVK